MRRRLLSFILAAALLLGMVPSLGVTARATTAYDAAAAVSYAKAHWNDGVGLCAQFVSKCLAAGGVTIPNKSCYSSTTASYENNRGALGKYTNPYLSSAALLLYLSERYQVITDPDWADIAVGDVVFMIGGSSGNKRDGHVGIIVKVTDGIPYYAAHNKATVTGRFYDSHPCTYVVKMSQTSTGGSTGGSSGDSGSESTCDCSVSYAGTYICTTESTELRIRSGHGTSYAKVGAIPKGATVTVTMSDGEWAHVEYDGISGYASMDYLTLQTPAVTLAAEHWISGGNMGSSITGLEQGSAAFVCCRLYDANSGSDLSAAADGEFTAAITVYDPDGIIVQTGTFSDSDRGSVEVACQSAGTYTYTIEVTGDWEDTFTGTFSVGQKTYSITYNANGGSGAPGSQTKIYGTALTLSATVPTRTGYTFLGWATSATATAAQYQPGGSYTANSGVTLYAVWKANTYTVTYNANGGSGAPGSQTKIYGTALTLSATVPTRTGYTFLGWATSATATAAQYQSGGSYTANSGATLYAVWKANTYTVTYNANGGSGAPGSQTKTYGTVLTLSATVPTRTGYTFLGWATSATATTAQYQPGGSYTANSGVTLYAVWKANNYTISYSSNGGSGAPLGQTKAHGTTLTLSSVVPTRTGYTFLGWATSATATTAQYQPGGSYTANSGVTLYAVWKENTYTVTYNANGGVGAPGSQTKNPGEALTLSSTVPTRVGYIFQGWATGVGTTTAAYQPGGVYTKDADCTLYALWQREKKSCGDADGDGYVDAYDASLIKKYSVGAIDSTDLNFSVCDLDGDGYVDAYDASLAQKYSVGAIDFFPVEQ